MTYQEFYDHIDCRFPYHDTAAWQQLIAQSLEIGGDAPFLVLHEICRLPSSVTLNLEQHLAMYAYWKAAFAHPVQKHRGTREFGFDPAAAFERCGSYSHHGAIASLPPAVFRAASGTVCVC